MSRILSVLSIIQFPEVCPCPSKTGLISNLDFPFLKIEMRSSHSSRVALPGPSKRIRDLVVIAIPSIEAALSDFLNAFGSSHPSKSSKTERHSKIIQDQ
jgi:hypothetical protein